MKRMDFSTVRRCFFCRSACSIDTARSTFCRRQVHAIARGELQPRLLRREERNVTPGTYEAANYDELIDCPVEMGEFQLGRFSVLDTPHEIVITGRVPKLDMTRMTADLAQLCETQIRMFEPRSRKPPFDRYTFLTMALGDG